MSISIKKMSVVGFLFFMQLHYCLGMSQYSMYPVVGIVRNLCFIVALFLLAIKSLTFNRLFSKSGILAIFVIVVCAFLAFSRTGGQTFLKLILFAIILKGVDEGVFFKYFYRINWLVIIFIVISSLTGIISNVKVVSDGRTLYSFGFNNTNTLALFLCLQLITLNYLNYRRIKPRHLLLDLVCAVAIERITNSRSATIAIFLFVALYIIQNNVIEKNKFLTEAVKYLFLIMSLASILIAALYDSNNAFWLKLNEWLSWRPYFWNKYYLMLPLTLWGNSIDLSETGALDNAYLMLIFQYGIIIFLIYAILFVSIYVEASKEKNRGITILIIVYEFYFFMEFSPILVNVNIVILWGLLRLWRKRALLLKRKGNKRSV